MYSPLPRRFLPLTWVFLLVLLSGFSSCPTVQADVWYTWPLFTEPSPPLDYEQLRLTQAPSSSDIRPVPDPTAMTTAQLYRELASLKSLIDARFDSMEKATVLLQKIADRMPADMEAKVAQLQALHAEKFRSIENQFASSKLALDSALQASEKAVAEQNRLSALAITKSEIAATKQIDQIQAMILSADKTSNDKIMGLKERVDRIEGQASGVGMSWGIIIGVIGIIGTGTAVIVVLIRKA